MQDIKRTLTKDLKDLGTCKKTYKLAGYIENIRDHGDIIFLDLNNEGHIFQLVFNKENVEEFDKIKALKVNSTIKVTGKIIYRGEDRKNSRLKNGEFELLVEEVKIVSISEPLPIDSSTVNESKLLEFRNIHLRDKKYQDIMKNKSDIMNIMRNYLVSQDFIEFETPILTRTTEGGAKDFHTLSSHKEQMVYGLSQSPQMFKQLLMTSNIEKYFQIAKCFRDEEMRSDRQPEFLQLDIEASWYSDTDIINLIDGLINEIEEKKMKNEFGTNCAIYPYKDVMEKYCSDKPDLRYNLELQDVSEILKDTDFSIFKSILSAGGSIKTITIPGDTYSKKERKDLEKLVMANGAKGLGYLLINEEGIVSPLLKFLSESELEIINRVSRYDEDVEEDKDKYKNNRIIYFVADSDKNMVYKIGDMLRRKFAVDLNLLDKDIRSYLWVYNFPMFEKKENGSIGSMHHPFTMPYEEDMKEYEEGTKDVLDIETLSYDLVLNGSEIGGGSVRIADRELQEKVFEMLEFDEEAKSSIEWFTELFRYGVPEHAGFAMGVDRLIQQLYNLDSIRESIPFPKNSVSDCPMTNAPSVLSKKDWKTYGLRT